jgi:hyperosmotically inducible periplasmic protein
MKKIIIVQFFIFLLAVTGCGTIYSTAMDERNMSTIGSDTTIKGTIVKKFYDDDKIKSLDISTGCYHGHVYLVGEYDTADQKNRAIKIAKSVEGVKNVTTYLLPKKKGDPCGTDENLEIVGKVKAKLVGDKDIWSTNIDIKSIQCQVVLYGLVGSKKEINKAIAHAKSVEGIRGVKSFLKSAN